MNHTKGVAIVDDEPDLVFLYEKVLARRGWHICFTARDGAEAAVKFAEADPKPRVVVIDYRMPTMCGIEAMQKMRETGGERTKFVFVSADDAAQDRALDHGAVVFLVKPVTIALLADTVGRLMAEPNNK
jgi:CheY-like chemotaxis protein